MLATKKYDISIDPMMIGLKMRQLKQACKGVAINHNGYSFCVVEGNVYENRSAYLCSLRIGNIVYGTYNIRNS